MKIIDIINHRHSYRGKYKPNFCSTGRFDYNYAGGIKCPFWL